MAAVNVANVSKSFVHGRAPREILHDVSLAVADGQFVSIVGRSGCGKTTLLRIIGGFVAADSGSVLIDSSPVAGPGSERGMLFQHPMLFPWLTVLDNTLFAPRAAGRLTAEARSRALALLHTVGLAGFELHYPKQLSGGMMHRAAFARAMMAEPKILLMDEPFGALDALTRAGMQQFLLDLWDRQRFTVVLVTHDVEEAVLLSDRVGVMASNPGEFVETIDITLPRPRTYEMSETTAFMELKRQVRQAVERARGSAGTVGVGAAPG